MIDLIPQQMMSLHHLIRFCFRFFFFAFNSHLIILLFSSSVRHFSCSKKKTATKLFLVFGSGFFKETKIFKKEKKKNIKKIPSRIACRPPPKVEREKKKILFCLVIGNLKISIFLSFFLFLPVFYLWLYYLKHSPPPIQSSEFSNRVLLPF